MAREFLIPGSISENSHEGPFLDPRPGTTQLLAAPSEGHLTQTTSKTSRGDRLPTDTPTHTTHTGLLVREGKIPPPTRRQAQVPPNMQPTQTTGPASPTDGKTKNESICQTQKVRYHEKTEKYCANLETR